MKRTRLMIPLIIVLLLAACSSAQSGGNGSVPVTGPTGGSGLAALPTECATVDFKALAATGQQYYEANCASCHGAKGEGKDKNPPLAGSAMVNTQDPEQLVTRFFNVPAHAQTITTDQAAAVFTYIRGAFGNASQPICSFQVLEFRPAQ